MSAASSAVHPGDTGDSASSQGIEWLARFGYAAKATVYTVIGILAVQMAFGAGGQTTGSRGALREIAAAPFGKVALGLVTVGLVGYVAWRLVQALMDPEADRSDDGTPKRWGLRVFYLLSAATYGSLAYYGATLVLDTGGASAGGSGGSGNQTWVAQLMGVRWGAWLIGAVGAGVVIRGLFQLVKAYTKSFKEKISSFELGPAPREWVIRASRLGLTSRAAVFGIIGGSITYAAITRDPQEARGLEGALDMLVTRPWLLGAVGVGLLCYAVYQWTKARYRLIGV